MAEENKIKCPNCGETEKIIIISKKETFDGVIITHKCLNCETIF